MKMPMGHKTILAYERLALILYTTADGITKVDVTYEQIKSSLSQGKV